MDPGDRPEPPTAADEATTLLGMLAFHRETLRWRTDVDTPADLRALHAAAVSRSEQVTADLLASGGSTPAPPARRATRASRSRFAGSSCT